MTSLAQAEGQNFGYDDMLDHEQRYDRAEEFLETAFELWGSWEEDALVQNRETGVFADPDRVHEINHVGEHFKVRGPLNVPRSPQQRPVIIQAGASSRGKDYAARWAEAIAEFRRYLELGPSSAEAERVKGHLALLNRGRPQGWWRAATTSSSEAWSVLSASRCS